MTARRPPLTHCGGDVSLRARTTDGRAIVDFVDRDGKPIGHSARCHPHELRGVGWHIGEIKKVIAALPLEGTKAEPPPEPVAPRPLLFAHHVAAHTDRQEDS